MASKWAAAAIAAESNASPAFSSPQPLRKPGQGSRRAASVLEILENLRITGNEELPKELIVNEKERPTISHDEWYDLAEIPVIDLSLVQTDKAQVLKQIRTAVTECGFFQIVNHGIPSELLKEAQSQGHNFFNLPVEMKERAALPDKGLLPYSGDNYKRSVTSIIWGESLVTYFNYLDRIVNQVWPDGNQEFLDMVTNFVSVLQIVAKQVLGLIAESFGLSTDYFARHMGVGKGYNTLRFNYYPACPQPTESLGAAGHTDPNLITLLLQDKVGGLQIEKDGNWIGVRPIEHALVVNIGDTLHAWTNGMCRSVLHRVVVNKEVPRLSIAAFVSADGRLLISPPDVLIDENNPRQYKDLTSSEYIMCMVKRRSQDSSRDRNGVAILQEHFRFEK